MLDTPKAGLKTLNHRSDWRTTRLKFLFKRQTRLVLETDEVITAFRDGTVTLRKNRREDGFTFAELEIGYQGIEPGDLVIHAMDGFAGAIGVSDSRGKGSPVLSIVTPRGDAEPRFWAYYLRNLAITGFIQSLAKGIRERSTDFRWKDASNLLVNFPDLATQRQIADFLDRETARIDLLIEKKQQLVKLLGEKHSTTITDAVTFNRDCAFGIHENTVRSLARNKQTSESWDCKKIKFHLAGFYGGGTPSKENLDYWTDGTVPWVTPKDMKRRKIDTAEDYITEDAVKSSATNMVPTGSVLMVVRSGILKHSLPVALTTVPVALNQDMKAFNFRKSMFPLFFAYWIEGQQKEKLLQWSQIGATVDNINVDEMLNSPISVPDPATQRQIADFLDRETARIDAIKDQTLLSIDRLKEYRSALITAAVTGQIDLQNHTKFGATERRLDAILEAS